MSEMQLTLSDEQVAQRDAFVERLLKSTSGVFDMFSLYLGHSLGFYRFRITTATERHLGHTLMHLRHHRQIFPAITDLVLRQRRVVIARARVD